MDEIRNGWFNEISQEMWPGQCFSLQVDEVLHHEQSDFQDVLIIKTKNHGNALILDGIIQCTEKDEFSYQEMISFLPVCSHNNPENVLLVGRGDGTVAGEVSKHPLTKNITQVEIDGHFSLICGIMSQLLHKSLGTSLQNNNKASFSMREKSFIPLKHSLTVGHCCLKIKKS